MQTMTVKEAVKVLAILKAAYPKDYPYNMSVDDAKVTAIVWAEQFINVPGEIVEIAIKKLISKEEKCCSIARVKKQIGSLYWEAKEVLDNDIKARQLGGKGMSEDKKAFYENIKQVTGDFKYSKAIELPLNQIVGKDEKLLLER